MKALFDTNILIDYLNGIGAAREEINRYQQVAISAITWMEVMVGTNPDEETLVRNFLSRFTLIPLTAKVAERAVEIRRATRIRLPDAIIRASAEIENALLISRNTKDFPASEPWVRIPYQLN